MRSNTNAPLEPRSAILVLVGTIALVFRVAAWLNPSSVIVISPSMALPLNGLGVLYLVCGIWAWRSRPSPLTRVFLAYGIGGCLHWGGTIASDNSGLEIVFLTIYAAASALFDGAFLDLSLRYPRAMRRPGFRTAGFYLLAIVTLLAVPIAPFLPRQTVVAGIGFVIFAAFMMSIAGGVVFLVKWFRATPAE